METIIDVFGYSLSAIFGILLGSIVGAVYGFTAGKESSDEYVAMLERRLSYSRNHQEALMFSYQYTRGLYAHVTPEDVVEMVEDYLSEADSFVETQMWQDIQFSYKSNGGISRAQWSELTWAHNRRTGGDGT